MKKYKIKVIGDESIGWLWRIGTHGYFCYVDESAAIIFSEDEVNKIKADKRMEGIDFECIEIEEKNEEIENMIKAGYLL